VVAGGLKKKDTMDLPEKFAAETPEPLEGAPYEAPKVLRVSLRPAEAVLGHCKVNGSAGPVSGSCRSGVIVCRTPGS
jgi:hypothetical protein